MVLDFIEPEILFGVDMSNSIHETNKTQSVLVLGYGLIQKNK